MYCTRKLGIFFAYCEHHAMFWCSYYAGFIKAFSNEPLCRLISAEPNQWFVREIISASISLHSMLVWYMGRQSVGGKTIKPVDARGNLH